MAVKTRKGFLESAEGKEIRAKLLRMAADATYNTTSSYSANTEQYPDNLIPFVDKHMRYLNMHPELDPVKYLANIRLMTRIR